jgi:ribosomal protein L29
MNKDKFEIKEMSIDQLKEKVELLRQELLGLKLNASTAHIKDNSQFKKTRKKIALALTYLNQKIKNP